MPATLGNFIDEFGQTPARAQPVTNVTSASSSPPDTGRIQTTAQPTSANASRTLQLHDPGAPVHPGTAAKPVAAAGGYWWHHNNSGDLRHASKGTDLFVALPVPPELTSRTPSLERDDALVAGSVRAPMQQGVTLIPARLAEQRTPSTPTLLGPGEALGPSVLPEIQVVQPPQSLDTDALVVPGARILTRAGVAVIVAPTAVSAARSLPTTYETPSPRSRDLIVQLSRTLVAISRRPPVPERTSQWTSTEGRERAAYDYFRSALKLKPFQAAALVGNMAYESTDYKLRGSPELVSTLKTSGFSSPTLRLNSSTLPTQSEAF